MPFLGVGMAGERVAAAHVVEAGDEDFERVRGTSVSRAPGA